MKRSVTILGFETSCDETAIALLSARKTKNGYDLHLREHLLHSQTDTHAKTGGVVPEVAAREHAVRLPLLLQQLTSKIGIKKLQKEVDAIAVTNGPGLVTSLLVGTEVARTISHAWKKPLVPVNHLEGHLYANLLDTNSQSQKSKVKNQNLSFLFPMVVLIVSGGHTELVLLSDHLKYKLLGETRDDAAGEAFDKTAKLLALPYPGGPALSALASKGKATIALPRPMQHDKSLDFSFSGLKTAVTTKLQTKSRKKPLNKAERANFAASIETAIVDSLVGKTMRAVGTYKPRMVALAGGVSANIRLRETLERTIKECDATIQFVKPKPEFSTDNAAMIAAAGAVRYLNGYTKAWNKVSVHPQLPLK